MKPHLVGSACHRVQAALDEALDEALGEGALSLPPALRSHAARCARCGPEVADTEALLARLLGVAAAIPMGQVPRVVDEVMARALGGPALGGGNGRRGSAAPVPARTPAPAPAVRRPADLRWLLGQIAVVAAVMAIGLGGTTYSVLKLHEALSGTSPAQVAERLAAPFRQVLSAMFHGGR